MLTELASVGAQPAAPSRQRRLPAAGAVLFGVVTVPAAVFYLGLSSSYALGTTLASLWVLSLRRPARAGVVGGCLINERASHVVTGGLLLVLLLHLLIASLLGPVDLIRATVSFVPMALTLLAGAALANLLKAANAADLHLGLMRCFCMLCAVGLLGATGWGPPSLAPNEWIRPVFPFSEPSTFALVFTPVLMYACVSTRGSVRFGWMVLGVACTLLIQNLTLVIGLLLVALVSLRKRSLVILTLPVVLGVAQLDVSYYVERLDLSGEVQNFSNLVYVQGWQMIDESLTRSSGFGLGFQQLGVFGTDVAAAELIRSLRDGEDLNVLDGGFGFAKLGGELGALGLLLAMIYGAMALRSIAALRRISRGTLRSTPAMTLAYCSIVGYLVELFVRSAGYFTGTALLMCASLWLLRSGHVQRWRQRPKRVPGAFAAGSL